MKNTVIPDTFTENDNLIVQEVYDHLHLTARADTNTMQIRGITIALDLDGVVELSKRCIEFLRAQAVQR